MNIKNYYLYRNVSARRSAGGIDSRMVESRLAIKDSTFDNSKVNVSSSSILMKFLYDVRSLISGISWVYAPCKYTSEIINCILPGAVPFAPSNEVDDKAQFTTCWP